MLIEKLTQKEIGAITEYRRLYGNYDEARYSADYIMPTKEWLKAWEEGKSKYGLANIFGGDLFVEFPIAFHESKDQISQRITDKLELTPFYRKLDQFIYEINEGETRRMMHCLTSPSVMAGKVFTHDRIELPYFDENLQKDKKLVLTKGMRLTSIYSKLNKYFKVGTPEEYEEFRQIYSTVFNSEVVKGTYVLSMRPLDYMSMSDNDYNWTSCMSWVENGCYRRGTVEMMTSPYVIVGYLKGDKPFSHDVMEAIDNKKWRCLFIVDRKIITSIKSYPYYSEELMEIGVKKLKELAEKNLGYSYEDTKHKTTESCFKFQTEDETIAYVEFETRFMYNDFGTRETEHNYFLTNEEDIINSFKASKYYANEYINYSGKFICSKCGAEEDYDDYSDSEGLPLICENCYGYCVCDCCGRRIAPNDETFETNDYDCVCQSCIEDYYYWVEYKEMYVRYEDVHNYCLAAKTEEEGVYKLSPYTICITTDDLYELEDFFDEKYSDCDEAVINCNKGECEYIALNLENVNKYNYRQLAEYITNLDEPQNVDELKKMFFRTFKEEW